MLSWLLQLQIQSTAFLATVGVLALVAAVVLLVRRPTRRWLITAAIAVVGGGALGYFLAWLVVNRWNLLDAAMTTQQLLWVGLAVAGVALAVVNLWRSRWWRKIVAIITIPLSVLAGGAFINASIGYYTTVSDALGMAQFHSGSLDFQHGDPTGAKVPVVDMKTWRAPAKMPKAGKIVSVAIPGTVSHFKARDAVVYLPPAARVENPPALPVVITLSGQPGQPSDWFTSGRIGATMNVYAAAHHGIAPIVVDADQLGNPEQNPMCVNSSMGNSATYITTDVVNWVTSHLHVATDRNAWSVFGFSQGATCATQFITGYSQKFGSSLSSESQIGPIGFPAQEKAAFGGSTTAAQAAAQPIAIMQKHGSYKDTLAVFGVGQTDTKYLAWAQELHTAAQNAGIDAKLYVSPGTGHDWHTVQYVVQKAMPLITRHMGIG
jgi:enterochelin esterase-like enzyme